jgi:hypothetical protein
VHKKPDIIGLIMAKSSRFDGKVFSGFPPAVGYNGIDGLMAGRLH